MESESPGDVTKLVFGEDSQVFASSILFMGMFICATFVLGTLYDMVRCLRSRWKVQAEGEIVSSLKYSNFEEFDFALYVGT